MTTTEISTPRTGKWWRLDDSKVAEVEVSEWYSDDHGYYAYTSRAHIVEVAELFESEFEALQVAIRALRDDEERIYRQRQQLMKRLEEIT